MKQLVPNRSWDIGQSKAMEKESYTFLHAFGVAGLPLRNSGTEGLIHLALDRDRYEA